MCSFVPASPPQTGRRTINNGIQLPVCRTHQENAACTSRPTASTAQTLTVRGIDVGRKAETPMMLEEQHMRSTRIVVYFVVVACAAFWFSNDTSSKAYALLMALAIAACVAKLPVWWLVGASLFSDATATNERWSHVRAYAWSCIIAGIVWIFGDSQEISPRTPNSEVPLTHRTPKEPFEREQGTPRKQASHFVKPTLSQWSSSGAARGRE